MEEVNGDFRVPSVKGEWNPEANQTPGWMSILQLRQCFRRSASSAKDKDILGERAKADRSVRPMCPIPAARPRLSQVRMQFYNSCSEQYLEKAEDFRPETTKGPRGTHAPVFRWEAGAGGKIRLW